MTDAQKQLEYNKLCQEAVQEPDVPVVPPQYRGDKNKSAGGMELSCL